MLEGGSECHDYDSCRIRWADNAYLMSSSKNAQTIQASLLLSSDCHQNPGLCTHNVVFVHYCTSDEWSGTRNPSSETWNFSFYGHYVMQALLEDLYNLHNLNDAELILFTGQSAGGKGVFANSQFFYEFVQQKNPNTKVYIIPDSGWALDENPYDKKGFGYVLKLGFDLWYPKYNQKCMDEFADLSYQCILGYKVYKYITAPIMSLSFLFDIWQLYYDGVLDQPSKDFSKLPAEKMQYIKQRGQYMWELYQNSTNLYSYFVVNCIDHVLTSNTPYANVAAKDKQGSLVFLKDAIGRFVRGDKIFVSDYYEPMGKSYYCVAQGD